MTISMEKSTLEWLEIGDIEIDRVIINDSKEIAIKLGKLKNQKLSKLLKLKSQKLSKLRKLRSKKSAKSRKLSKTGN